MTPEIYLIQIIPPEKTRMKTPLVDMKTILHEEPQRQQKSKKLPFPDEAILQKLTRNHQEIILRNSGLPDFKSCF